jgi:hypothetical protein
VRIDAATGQKILAEMYTKYRNQTSTPGSEAALRRVIEGVLMGKPNYGEMAPWLAKYLNEALAVRDIILRGGAVRSIEFRGVNRVGADIYEVHQEGSASNWSIFLDTNGLIVELGCNWW